MWAAARPVSVQMCYTRNYAQTVFGSSRTARTLLLKHRHYRLFRFGACLIRAFGKQGKLLSRVKAASVLLHLHAHTHTHTNKHTDARRTGTRTYKHTSTQAQKHTDARRTGARTPTHMHTHAYTHARTN